MQAMGSLRLLAPPLLLKGAHQGWKHLDLDLLMKEGSLFAKSVLRESVEELSRACRWQRALGLSPPRHRWPSSPALIACWDRGLTAA